MSRFFCCLEKPSKSRKLADLVNYCGEAIDMAEIQTGFTVHDRKLIRETGETIYNRQHIENKGVDFLIMFFKQYPHHQRYFKAFRNVAPDELKNIPKLENHGRRVMDQISLLVNRIDDHVYITEQVSSLQDRHGPRRVRSRQFKDMLTAFVDFVKMNMGEKFTEQHDRAWQKFITHFLDVADDRIKQKEGGAEPEASAKEEGNASGDDDGNTPCDDDDHSYGHDGDGGVDHVDDDGSHEKLESAPSAIMKGLAPEGGEL